MRAFVAIEISKEEIVDAIHKFQSEIYLDVKAVEPKNLHFTLQFLGEVSEERIENVKEALKKIKFSNFTVNFMGIGAFPKMKFPRVVWIGTDKDGGNALVELARKVENALTPLGFRNDKPFKPHITIFRIKNKIGDITKELGKFESFEFGTQDIVSFKLKQSILTSKGPVYLDLEEVCGAK